MLTLDDEAQAALGEFVQAFKALGLRAAAIPEPAAEGKVTTSVILHTARALKRFGEHVERCQVLYDWQSMTPQ